MQAASQWLKFFRLQFVAAQYSKRVEFSASCDARMRKSCQADGFAGDCPPNLRNTPEDNRNLEWRRYSSLHLRPTGNKKGEACGVRQGFVNRGRFRVRWKPWELMFSRGARKAAPSRRTPQAAAIRYQGRTQLKTAVTARIPLTCSASNKPSHMTAGAIARLMWGTRPPGFRG